MNRKLWVPHVSPLRHGRTTTTIKAAAAILLAATGALAFQAVRQATRPRPIPTSLATLVPQGALLTIESPDFAALLQSWNKSPQQQAWLSSDNYSVFSNSRLFGRLNDARSEFEGLLPNHKEDTPGIDSAFLTQIAGHQSTFAWYDVGALEFLYITRMPAAQAAKFSLLSSHAGFASRQSGGSTFYIRKSTGESQPRTVAFAHIPSPSGDLLILATREDLIASALLLLQSPTSGSVTTEPWYTDALAASPAPSQNVLSSRSAAEGSASPALHMVLNLDRLVPLPAFHTYWVQQNITQMKQYRSAVSDLYLEGNTYRDERTLLLKSPSDQPATPVLSDLASLVPANSGVYRTTATHDPAIAITALEEKLLGRATLEKTPDTNAPDPTLSAPQSGDTADLETRIDTPAPVSATFSNEALTAALKSAAFDAVLTWSTALPPSTPTGLWIPIHNAVVLHSANPWNPQSLQSALQQSLRGQLTTSTLGIDFRQTSTLGIFELTGPKHLYLATRANLAFLTDDQPLLATLLAAPAPAADTNPATLIAGFDHPSQRAPYTRLTSLIDGTNQPSNSLFSRYRQVDAGNIPPEILARLQAEAQRQTATDTPAPNLFFSHSLKSLSDTFAALTSEHFVERPIDTPSGPAIRQTVTYQWK